VIDPIDGTIAYARGLPLYSTLIALVAGGESVFGLIDLPALGERYIGWKGGGCRRNGQRVEVSQATDLDRALISHGDPICFDRAGLRSGFDRMAAEIPMLRGYTDSFGHAQVLAGGIDAMVDVDLNPWDAAASQVLVAEAGGRCITRAEPSRKLTLVLGSPPLVEQLADMLGF
jgi:myo-inositol-1(or 4)-monophosphatase